MFKNYALVFCASLLLISCAAVKPTDRTGAENAADLNLQPVAFSQLPGWQQDEPGAALTAFRRSCAVMMKRGAATPVAPTAIAGTIANWQPACNAATTATNAKAFFQTYFNAYQMTTSLGDTGLYTGYYETMLNGSPVKTAQYNVPLYRRPADLVMVELGEFRPSLKGQRIAGTVRDGKLKPFADRAAIENGALAGKGLEILWVDDADAAFFLHIQGSGRVRMTDGRIVRVGYDGQNGHVYYAIGRELIARGELTPETTSLQSIRAWLKAHPREAVAMRQKNPSFIFFRELDNQDGPIGAQNVALTAERSLAVDPRFVPYGAPLFLQAPHPLGGQIQRLLIAQDTGGAITGPIRGDVFWGAGPRAEEAAGLMKSRGKAWILLPKTIPAPKGIR